MRDSLEEVLFKEFPVLYKNHARCFECGDGWFLILLNLSMKLEPLLSQFSEEHREQFKVAVVKEKFGLLRFDCDYSYEDRITCERMHAIIHEAEEQSGVTCENCGQAGKFRKTSWLHVHCDPCEEVRIAKTKASWKEYNAKAAAKKLEKATKT